MGVIARVTVIPTVIPKFERFRNKPWLDTNQHQGCREPIHSRAKPSLTRMPPKLSPFRVTTRNFRPYLSSSLAPDSSRNGPSLRSSCNRFVARSPRSASYAQRGGWVSGASMSMIRTFTPSTQKVSPSTTQFWPPPTWQKPKVMLRFACAVAGLSTLDGTGRIISRFSGVVVGLSGLGGTGRTLSGPACAVAGPSTLGGTGRNITPQPIAPPNENPIAINARSVGPLRLATDAPQSCEILRLRLYLYIFPTPEY